MILRAPDEANFVAFIPLSYIIPSYVLYLITFYVLFLSKSSSNFNGSFYSIFGFSSINLILYQTFYYFYTRAMACPAFLSLFDSLPSNGFFITSFYVLLYNTQYSTFFFDVLLVFNRFTVILFKTSYISFWRKYLLIMIVLGYFLPNLLTWHIWFSDVRLQIYNASDPSKGYILDSFAPPPFLKNSLVAFIVVFTSATMCFLMNGYVCVYLAAQKYKNKSKNISSNKVSPQNMKLFCFNLLIFGNELAYGMLQVLYYVIPNATDRIKLFSYQVYLTDLVTLTPPWFLIALSTVLRQKIMQQICQVKIESNNVTIIPSTPGNLIRNSSIRSTRFE